LTPGTNNQHLPSLGEGIYPLSEVARYTQASSGTVWSWFKQRADRKGRGAIFHSDYDPVQNDYAVSFLDLIDVWVAVQLRKHGVAMTVLRRSYDVLRSELETKHPFAHSDIYTDGQHVFVWAADQIGDKNLSEVISHQYFFEQIQQMLTHVDYSNETHLAERWRISTGVVIDPSVSLGKPVVVGTGTSTFVMAQSYWANNCDESLVADLFNVTEQDVLNAVRFESEYARPQAA